MKYTPILYSTPMVEAQLDDTKSMTRRTTGLDGINENPDDWRHLPDYNQENIPRPAVKYDTGLYFIWERVNNNMDNWVVKCPYGNVGDVLWVRETFEKIEKDKFRYKANDISSIAIGKWKPNIHMPKIACRLFLEITNIRVERLQGISEVDAKKEGVIRLNLYEKSNFDMYKDYHDDTLYMPTASGSFMSLWESINGEKSWDANPWVWVIEFKRVDKPLNWPLV